MISHSTTHAVLFPFMSKGHTIPIFDLALLLLTRKISITIFTTPVNRPFFSDSLPDTNINIIRIPFPENIQGIPPGVESTDKLPSMFLFPPFANATKLMKPHFEKALDSLPPVTFMITDDFLGFVKCEGLEKPIREFMEGDKGKEARKKVKEIGEEAINAVKEGGGTSCQALNEVIYELSEKRQV